MLHRRDHRGQPRGDASRRRCNIGQQRALDNKAPFHAPRCHDLQEIAVGAQDARGTVDPSDDRAADFSSNGTDDWALTSRSPDFTAPGVSLPSLRVPGSYLDRNYGGVAVLGTRFFKGSGSSQAAAVVAGAAALIISQRPYATPDQVKALLRNGGIFVVPETRGAQGTGRMNLWSVLNRTVSETPDPAAPPSLGNGSVDVSRGSKHVSLNGTAITGNVDIFGHPFDSAALSGLAANTAAWSGGTWNGSTWTGSTWTGSTWTGSTWTGSTWTGSTWTGSTWTGSTWTGSTWTGDSWASALPPRKHPLKPVKH